MWHGLLGGARHTTRCNTMLSSYPPPAPLAPIIEFLWIHDSAIQAEDSSAQCSEDPSKERVLPTGFPGLVINLTPDQPPQRAYYRAHPTYGERLAPTLFHGVWSESYVMERPPLTASIGVQFKRGGAAALLPLPLSELQNVHVPLEDLWGAQAQELRERLLDTSQAPVRVRLLAQALLARAARPRTWRPAIDFALRTFEEDPQALAWIADRTGFSERHFRTLFRAHVGLSPKQYCRLRRLRSLVRHIPKGTKPAWASLAQRVGYYDQAHLANEFRALTGMSPTAYARDRHARFPTYVPLPE
jgi:AraC-like DNA-binding protein